MIMNDEPQCVENEPRFKIKQKVWLFDKESEKIISREICSYQLIGGIYCYDLYLLGKGFRVRQREHQLFPDFHSCKIAAHATYLQKIKDLLEQKDE